jgi:ELWxxDGT repeat protein
MKQFYKKICLLMLLCTSIGFTVPAQNFNLIDVNTFKNANPQNYQQNTGKAQFAVLHHIAYFTADDGIHGSELWCSDGALGGTRLVKDINPGNASSDIQDIISSGGKIYFSAHDALHGQEIWVSDGTVEGTKMLKDIYAGPAGSNPSYITDVNDTAYFFTSQNFSDVKLWKTDGTREGTKLVADFYTGKFMYAAYAQYMVNVNGHIFFTLYNSTYGAELWTSDGTKEGTHITTDINPFGGSNPSNLTSLKGLLYFAADDGTGGSQLFVSDGTATGTHTVPNTNTIYIYNRETPFTVKNNVLYFEGGNSTFGFYELCKYDPSGTSNNVKLVKDINPGSDPSYLYNITNISGTLFFTAFDGSVQGLWKSDGTEAGTQLVYSVPGRYLYNQFTNYNGELLYSFYDDAHGWELWKSDGTTQGTKIVKNIFQGIYGSVPNYFTNLGNDIIFSATDEVNGTELWRTNGTAGGTTFVKNINQTSTSSSYPSWLTPIQGNKLLFTLLDNKYGDGELWKSDGTDAGTHLVKDMSPGLDGANARFFTNLNGVTYFFANSDGFYRLWKTDGTKAGTSVIPVPDLDNDNSALQQMMATDNLLYFLSIDFTTYQYELWRSDGTAAGTYKVTSYPYYYSTELKPVGTTLYFTHYDDTNGFELWKSNGTVAGTKLVKDIAPGSAPSYPQSLAAYNGKLFFYAFDEFSRLYLWSSDGTKTGTKSVKELAGAGNFPPIIANGRLFFYAIDLGYLWGYELWSTDGTTKGTKLVKDINPGYNNSVPDFYNSHWIGTDSLLYFLADDGSHGAELWKSNGTRAGTHLVKDITAGSGGSNLSWFTNVAERVYFVKDDTLWTSDGTAKGTVAIDDATLSDVTQLRTLTASGNKLYFTGYTYAVGYELYAGDVNNQTGKFVASKIANEDALKTSLSFNVSLYPNPAASNVILQMTGNAKNISVSITDVTGKKLWQRNNINATLIKLPIDKYASGTYIVTVTNGKESKTIKLVKQ